MDFDERVWEHLLTAEISTRYYARRARLAYVLRMAGTTIGLGLGGGLGATCIAFGWIAPGTTAVILGTLTLVGTVANQTEAMGLFSRLHEDWVVIAAGWEKVHRSRHAGVHPDLLDADFDRLVDLESKCKVRESGRPIIDKIHRWAHIHTLELRGLELPKGVRA
jgi:hypothetical protein